jgi:hypothetical protein
VLRDPGYTDALRVLLKAGVDITPATPGGLTALALAQQYGYTHFTQLLRSADRNGHARHTVVGRSTRLRTIHFRSRSARSFAAREPVPGPIPFNSV